MSIHLGLPEIDETFVLSPTCTIRVRGLRVSTTDPTRITVEYTENGHLPTSVRGLEEFWSLVRGAATRRPPVDEYFMTMAYHAATRATCNRKHVGAVIVRDGHAIATGYNGSAPGSEHCDDVGHDILVTNGVENCVRTTHAEMNAILQAAKFGQGTSGASLYTNTFPCWPCAKAILGAGVVRVVFDADYKNDARVEDAFKRKGVALIRYKWTSGAMELPAHRS